MSDWFHVANSADIPSPALLVYPERIRENVRRMIGIAGGAETLRPHMKTHKMPEVIRLQIKLGITRFKCATIAEAEMTAATGAEDVLLAYQPVGPNVDRFLELVARFPSVRFSCAADNPASVGDLSDAAARSSARLEVLVDLDVGQHRTGIPPDAHAAKLYRLITALPALRPGGLHAYDGHIHDPDVAARTINCEAAFAPVEVLRRKLPAAHPHSPCTPDAATLSAVRARVSFGTRVTERNCPIWTSFRPPSFSLGSSANRLPTVCASTWATKQSRRKCRTRAWFS